MCRNTERYGQDIKEIETSLCKHNWETFKKYYIREAHYELPSYITLYSPEHQVVVGYLPINKNTFHLIESAEYECG